MTDRSYSRRSAIYFGGVGLLNAFAGCISMDQSQDSPTATQTEGEQSSSDEEMTEQKRELDEPGISSDGISVTISKPRVQKIISAIHGGSSAHPSPKRKQESQFLVVSVSTNSTHISSLNLTPVVNGTRFDTRPYRESLSRQKSGPLGFAVPIKPAETAAIEWHPPTGERFRWELSQSVVDDISSSPEFEIERFVVPDKINSGSRFEARLTVRNYGDRDGRFLGVIRDGGPSDVPWVNTFKFSVQVGESVDRKLAGGLVGNEQSTESAILDWGIDSREVSFSTTS